MYSVKMWLHKKYSHSLAKLRRVNLKEIIEKYLKDGLISSTDSVAIYTYDSHISTDDWRSRDITLIDVTLSKSKRHTELTQRGPFDAIIDLGAADNRHVTLLHTFFHLKPGGTYIIPDGARELTKKNIYKNAQEYLNDIIDLQANDRPLRVNCGIEKDNTKRYKMGLAWAIDKVAIDEKDIVLTRSNVDTVRIKLREYEMDRIQKTDQFAKYATIESIQPQRFKAKVNYNVYGYDKNLRKQSIGIEQPLLSLRRYSNVVVGVRQVVADDRIFMPDTFRLNSRAHLINNALDELNPRAAALRYPTTSLPKKNTEVYYHLDDEHRGHFGHLLTETISRIWAWPMVKELHPDAKVLVCASKEFSYIPEYEYQFYEAAGIAREDIVLLDGPTKIGTLYSAAPMFSNPNYIHPRIVESWKLVGDNLASTAKKKKTYPTRIFCSRKQSRRACNNGEEIETLFKKNGFTIVYPEDHSLGEQVQMFRHAEVVAGYAGSSLFTVIFAENPKHVIILRPNTYAAENEFLISSVIGGRLDIIISKADDPTSNESSFTVDFENEGADLVKILGSLE